MSDPIFPLAVWESGTLQNSIPANDNALRTEAINRNVISDSTTSQPGSPSDGDVYIIPAAATGAAWTTFDENDIALYRGGTWYAFAPVVGLLVNVAGLLKEWDGASWISIAGGGGSVSSVNGQTGTVVIEAGDVVAVAATITGTTYTIAASDNGMYLRFTNTSAKTVAIDPDATTPLPANGEWAIRNHGANNLTISPGGGVTVNLPSGGSLVIGSGGSAMLKRIATDVFDLI